MGLAGRASQTYRGGGGYGLDSRTFESHLVINDSKTQELNNITGRGFRLLIHLETLRLTSGNAFINGEVGKEDWTGLYMCAVILILYRPYNPFFFFFSFFLSFLARNSPELEIHWAKKGIERIGDEEVGWWWSLALFLRSKFGARLSHCQTGGVVIVEYMYFYAYGRLSH